MSGGYFPSPGEYVTRELLFRVPIFQVFGVNCPTGCGRKYEMGDMIIHLNDTHRWTREEIADWLDDYCACTGHDQYIEPPKE